MNTCKQETDWTKINADAFAHSMIPVALPQRDNIPFWNAHARQFIMPPAFEAPLEDGAAEYLYTLKNSKDETIATFKSPSPRDPLTPVWDKVPVGDVKLSIAALDKQGNVMKEVFTREFYRCAWFHGPYRAVSHDYRAAGLKVFSYIYNLPHVQGWLNGGTVDDKVYRKYCYPSKTLSAIIRALLLYADIVKAPEVEKKAIAISCKMADWLVDNSCEAGTPLEFLPPTYWKYASYHMATPHIGQIMMIYPTTVGNVYLTVYERTGNKRYLDAAIRLGNTMKKLELPEGSWKLKIRESDGKPTVENVVLITGDMVAFFNRLTKISGDASYKAMSDRAYKRLFDHNLKLWDWDGQFEDVVPTEMYHNLTKNHAHSFAADLLQQGDVKTALEIIDWTEDQFVIWSDANPGLKCPDIYTPCVLEQYNCYWPVDASMANFISIWGKVYKATGNKVYLEKAKTLADAVLCNQRPDGSIPTWFFTIDLPDWLNCMGYTASTLLELADIVE